MNPQSYLNNTGYGQYRRDEKSPNRITDKMAGHLCILYLLVMLAFLAWQLFDTWVGRNSILRPLGYAIQRQQTFRLIVFTLIAGALGGVVNGLRSTLQYCHEGFDRQYTWKYLCAPWMGATLALFVYALLRSSISVLSGNAGGAGGNIGNTQVLSNFSAGALVGYGSKDVFVWLDAKVEKFFHVKPASEVDKRKEGAASSYRKSVQSPTSKVQRPIASVNQGRGPQTAQPETLMEQGEPVVFTVASNGYGNGHGAGS